MRRAGRKPVYVFAVWDGIAVASGLAAMAGNGLPADAAPAVLAAITAAAGGAILAMVADTMVPEAFAEAHLRIGLITVTGFPTAFCLSHLQG